MRRVTPLFLLWLAVVSGQQVDLTDLSLEEFLNVEVVSVTKTRQKLSRTAAAVYVITGADIRRSGAATIADALRLAPGVHLARVSGTAWAVGIRGFNSTYSNKLLVLVDGRSVYHPLFSGVVWNLNTVMLEDVERIEVIRGPGATMWGANAVNGVINIVTRNAAATQGGLAAVSAGSPDAVRTRVRYGGRMGRNGAWRGSAQYGLLGQLPVGGLEGRLDRWNAQSGSWRMDWVWGRESFMVEGDWRRADSAVPHFVYSRGSDPGVHGHQGGGSAGFGLARWTRATRFGGERTVQTYFERSRMDTGLLAVDLGTWDADVQQTAELPGGHHVIAGGGVRSNSLRSSSLHGLRFAPPRASYHMFNGFVQDDWHLQQDRLVLTLGAKLEHYDRVGVMAQPSARLLWAPGKRHVYWVSYARAARTPSHSDYAMQLAIGIPGTPLDLELLGNPDVRPEILNSTEAGGRWQLTRKLAADVSAFWYRYSGLHSFLFDREGMDFAAMRIPARTVNGMHGRNRGGEAVAYLDVRPGWQVVGSYSALFESRQPVAAYQTQLLFTLPFYSPRHQAQVRSAWDLGRRWTLDAGVSRIGRLVGAPVDPYQRVDVRLARKVGEWTEISVSGQNLLPPGREFAGDLVFPIGASRRVWEIGFTRRF